MMKTHIRTAFLLILVTVCATACEDSNANPADPSQVNIEFTTTDITVGTGNQAANGNTVTVHYTGWLYNSSGTESKGAQFDTSLDGDPPYEVTIGQRRVIPGFEQALIGMRVGGKRRAYIPSGLAYGSSGTSDGTIPPNAALVFEMELMTVR
jgi:FKBP-type peptidyl-prolyl cis-trans isomerase FkpA